MQRNSAIVLGASMGGLLAARVLSEAFGRVTVVERDELPAAAAPRRGVPQSRHPHGVLARGLEVMEDLLPGLTDDLVAHGALPGDLQTDVRWHNDGHLLQPRASGMRGIAVSRPLLEDRVRSRVLDLPGVEILAPSDVLDLTAERGRVTGVQLRSRAPGSAAHLLESDLVVDATGRGSHTPVWLASLGFPRPEESVIEVGIGYTTAVFPRREGDLGNALAVIIGPTVATPRFGVALAMEGARWMVSIGGYRGDHAPVDGMAGYREYAETLPALDVADLIRDRDPMGTFQPYRFQSSTRRHYERLARFPDGLLVVGDALSSFNPIYGQGMTVAALEALALRTSLAEDAADLAPRFFRRAARVIDGPWDIAAGGDLRIPQVPGPRSPRVRMVNAYVSRVQAAAAADPDVGLAFLRVANLLDRPESLLRPSVAARVVRAGPPKARRRGFGIPRPRSGSTDRPTSARPGADQR